MNEDRGEKGEDWEHEEERADDDLDQGDDVSELEMSPTAKRLALA